MKQYGLVIEHELTVGGRWSPNLFLDVAAQDDRVARSTQVNLAELPKTYSGRDFFTFASSDQGSLQWWDVYRLTAPEKLTPPQLFQREEMSCIAHVLASVGQEPILVLIGPHDGFDNIKVEKILDVQGFRDLMVSYYPKIQVKREGNIFTAASSCPAEMYWETTGGILSSTRTTSGQETTLQGADPGTRVRVGWKYFSNVVEVTI